MSPISISIITAMIISALSLIGTATFSLKDKLLRKILIILVSFSAGSLIGSAFFHLMPEGLEKIDRPLNLFVYVIIGLSTFFILERVIRWHHCHDKECETHKHLGYLNLIGDSVHNIIDGIIIFSAFSISPVLGIPISISIVMHELPQEIGDFGVLLYAGFNKSKALFYNFITALAVLPGVVIGYLLFNRVENINSFLLPFAAGGFIYIATSDLIPELHKQKNSRRSAIAFFFFFVALIFMYLLKVYS